MKSNQTTILSVLFLVLSIFIFQSTVVASSDDHDSDQKEEHDDDNIVIKTIQVDNTNSQIIINATSIKSGKKLMDKNIYKALNTENNPEIIYKLKKVKSIVIQDNQTDIHTIGELSVAGNTRVIELLVIAQIPDNGLIHLSGKTKLKMTDYGISPPIALFGTIRTGDEIIIDFNLILQKEKNTDL